MIFQSVITNVCVCVCVCFSEGLQAGDVIMALNGQRVKTTQDIHEVLRGDRPLLMEIRRGSNDLLFNIQPQVIPR